MKPLTAWHLLSGPRGRRFLMEFARTSEQLLRNPDDRPFHEAEFWGSYRMQPPGAAGMLFGTGSESPPTVTPAEVARALDAVPLLEANEENLRPGLADAAALARYWQVPDGTDALAATDELREALHRVAEHVVSSPEAQRWVQPVQLQDQHVVHWEGERAPSVLADVPAALEAWRHEALKAEVRDNQPQYRKITAGVSGEWWSFPLTQGHSLLTSTASFSDGSPAGLWWVEDPFDWEAATTRGLELPSAAAGLRILEITGPEVWAGLCWRYPLEVTYQKRHDWYRTTGREGRWIIPDWYQVAQDYDAVHLTTACYVQAAGTAIPVEVSGASAQAEGAEYASVIAGWHPDQTYWFTSQLALSDRVRSWVLDGDGPVTRWLPSS
ncbi:hypothetical protein [Nesterenkonia flava]|uniref:Uncharacterized protein n=1 Tax=Nesterenkonia flava TaxID=469799 RepID=A0ABU1FTW7_9MICC|nr:hypothetical protein [Nesterenkonia flava]MDR5712104.1 hypothetical protein [Nesterenkonia flava]